MSNSSFTNKSCYRLYAGHGNWINLTEQTTQDLLQVFQRGEPCRYTLAAGLYIDIIPNDVDCNSKNIDMVGLMRADLVYEPQSSEHEVQQQMSHYVRSLLDDQGIIDAFPPLRQGEDLPIVTSLPTHRHLSLVPSMTGTVRRGPKPNNSHLQRQGDSDRHSSTSSSATSSVTNEDEHLHFSSSSTTTQGSSTTARKRAGLRRNQNSKRGRQAYSESSSPVKRQQQQQQQQQTNISALEPHNSSNTASYSLSHVPLVPFGEEENASFGLPFQQRDNSIWLPSYHLASRPASQASKNPHHFEFGMEDLYHGLQQRQSPIDILHEYNSYDATTGSFGEHGLYSDEPLMEQQQRTSFESHGFEDHKTSASTSIESYVPASPIPSSNNNHWIEQRSTNNNIHWLTNPSNNLVYPSTSQPEEMILVNQQQQQQPQTQPQQQILLQKHDDIKKEQSSCHHHGEFDRANTSLLTVMENKVSDSYLLTL
ncbi:MAG: hypothetical protein EXX96DRAFT_632475 [Benjaminiella poitrasii]|nr:MAG: hypothetical protein EXX96DRAFT_632475 [Benjaminiella poitrasii]